MLAENNPKQRHEISLNTGSQSRVGVEELFEAGTVGWVELVAAAPQREPRLEHLAVERGLDAGRAAALDVAAHSCQPGAEPADHMKAVQHVAGVPEAGVDGGLVRLGAV